MPYGDFLVKPVLNSGPIIHLSEVNCFDALQIADVIIPSAVYYEVTRYDKPGSKELQNSHIPVIWLNEEEKVFAMRLCSAYGIDAGEAEAIALCLSRKYQPFFTDDSDARDVSELLCYRSSWYGRHSCKSTQFGIVELRGNETGHA
ncbi:MAG: hypothetical protein U9N46_05760 [Euryarchaeota archaeon]|nr:hypothetical protein [Euryarchaeota archaeon]